MDGVELFLLGRTLMKLGEEALPTDELGHRRSSVRNVLIVVGDVRTHPGSAVGEIATRTGLPQSAVSTAVARLREAGAVVTEPDPRDRRRLLVRPAPEVSERVAQVRSASIDAVLAKALGDADRHRVSEFATLLERLAARLTPDSVNRLGS